MESVFELNERGEEMVVPMIEPFPFVESSCPERFVIAKFVDVPEVRIAVPALSEPRVEAPDTCSVPAVVFSTPMPNPPVK